MSCVRAAFASTGHVGGMSVGGSSRQITFLNSGPTASGTLNSTQFLPKRRLDVLNERREIDFLGVELVDDDRAGQTLVRGLGEHLAGVHLDAVDGGDDDDGRLDGGERFEGRADEVRIAGGVEDVEVLAVVIDVEDVGVDGEVVFMFLVVGVGDGGPVVHAAHPIDRVGLEEQGIGQAGLARGAVPHECNVPDVLHQVLDGHERLLVGEMVTPSSCQIPWKRWLGGVRIIAGSPRRASASDESPVGTGPVPG